jgi:cytochrome P450
MSDVQTRLKALGPTGITDPFTSVYEIVFQLTMRTVGCNEVAENPELLEKALRYNETIEKSGTMAAVMFPWVPSPALIKRTIAGAKMYRIFDKIVKERKATGRREDDSLQFMIDEGDSVRDIISVCAHCRLNFLLRQTRY